MMRLRKVAMTWGPLPGADRGGVFAVADAADVVERFDPPVPAYPLGELGWGGLAGGQASDGVDGGGPPFPASKGPDTAGEADGLGGVGEGQPGGDGAALSVRCSWRPWSSPRRWLSHSR
jgi:hypothetical protein